jgi:HEPN domain-containing protein
MTAKADLIRKHARKWLRHAEEDLRLARHAFELKSAIPYKLIAYHAQQCAEKCLKGYLVYKQIDFPYTHNISLLLEMLPPSAGWSKDILDAAILSSYAITTRYPGKDRVTKKEAVRALSLADTVRETVIKALAQEGLKISRRAGA